ncbi:FAD:protein FMN transferase [Aeromicrobium chenweiae]|uniref:FAD:protein FMN transferase n=1 Tax=Aeromicrobium chenweiae TaxID=2079793 RepID=A0A2S0WQT7_9ACTN|nr:FAD:protein FMN transferase [Aeromicrobium chenweiae]AWB93677.1 FAD:protein FMN transferase [Aeromicrobium chenweiae]TGN30475.1 FAD:protein FMN transferase [Aeromicrobium chenweiae]
MHAWAFEAIGTAWQIDTREPLPADVEADVLARIDGFDRTWSRFRDDSLVTRIAREPGEWLLPDEAGALLSFYDELHAVTDGAVNPLVGRTLADLGYDADYSLVAAADPAPVPRWESIRWDAPMLTTHEPVLLDVGAAGKGLLVDLVTALLAAHAAEATVDASGDIRHGGSAPLTVALEHPADPTRAIGVVDLAPGTALCASATNRRAWGSGLHHVLDARTGRPTEDVVATWVVAPRSCMTADGLATAHFFAEPGVLAERFPHDFVRMHADGRVEWSADFPGEVFT